MNNYHLPYNNKLEESSTKRLKGKEISEGLKNGSIKKGDIFCFGKHEYRYVGQGDFQRYPIGKVMWLHTNHLDGDLYSFTEGSFEKVYEKNIPHKIRIQGEVCIVTFKEDGSITWENKDGKKGRFGNSKGITPIQGFRMSLKREKKEKTELKQLTAGKVKENISDTKKGFQKQLDPLKFTQTNSEFPFPHDGYGSQTVTCHFFHAEIPNGTFLAPGEIISPGDEELPVYPQPSEDDMDRKLEKFTLLNIPEFVEVHGVNVSEISNQLLEIATQRANERLVSERVQKGFFGKAGMFFTRKKRLEQLIDEELEKLKEDGTFSDTSRKIRENASARNESENILFQNISPSASLIIPEINTLARDFVHGKKDQKKIEAEFEKFISEHESCSNITDTGSNIILELIPKREVFSNIQSGDFNAILDNPDQRNFLEQILGVDEINDYNQNAIISGLQSAETQEQLKNQEIEISLDVFTEANNRAFSVQDNEKKSSSIYQTGKTLQKHAWKSAGIYAATIGGLSVLTAGAGTLATLGVTALGSLGIGGKTGARRYAEYTDAHNQAQDRIVTGRETRLNDKKIWGTKSDKQLYGRTRDISHEQEKDRETADYGRPEIEGVNNKQPAGTMHHHFMPIERLNARLEKILKGESLRVDNEENKEQDNIDAYLAQALARLDMHRQTGHNFFRTTKKYVTDRAGHMEEQMSQLQRNIISVAKTRKIDLGNIIINDPNYEPEATQDLKTLRNSPIYLGIIDKLNADFNFANRKFKKIRRSTSIKTGAIIGGFYALTSGLSHWFTSGTETVIGEPSSEIIGMISGGLEIDASIATDLQNTLGTIKYQAFIENIQSANGPETLWNTLTKDIFYNNALGNDVKNEIMTFILNATDVQAGITKPELLIEAGKQGLFTDISSSSPRIDTVISKLSDWGYGNINKQWLINTITGINDGSISISTLNSIDQTKVSEALWCYVHRNASVGAQPMLEVFMDRLPDIPEYEEIPGKPIKIDKNSWGIGIPTWRNTFLPILKAKEDTQLSESQNFAQESKAVA